MPSLDPAQQAAAAATGRIHLVLAGPGSGKTTTLAGRFVHLVQRGVTAKMIMSILGHTTLAEAERYTEDADQERLAEDAVVKLEAHRVNRIAQTTSGGLGKAAKTKTKST